MNLVNDIAVSETYYLSEFESPDTHEVMVKCELVDRLQRMKRTVGLPVRIESGYRTPEYNKALGADPKSLHLIGQEVDVSCVGASLVLLAIAAVLAGFQSVIVDADENLVHCGLGPREQIIVPAVWSYTLKNVFPDKQGLVYMYENVFPKKP